MSEVSNTPTERRELTSEEILEVFDDHAVIATVNKIQEGDIFQVSLLFPDGRRINFYGRGNDGYSGWLRVVEIT